MIRPLVLLGLALALFVCPSPGAAEPLRIVIIGDSTVSEYPAERPDRGWGHYIEESFRPGTVDVTNLAVPGRSTKTFIEEGRWEKALQLKPAYVLIQFGHNDSHDPKNPEATDAASDYRSNLRRYIDDSRAIAAVPILVTPMVRRTFEADGRFTEALSGANRPLGDYTRAMKEVGAEKHVPVIDLYTSSRALVEKLGPERSAELANRPGDNTHFNEKGARAMAKLVLEQLPEAAPELAKLLRPAGTPPGGGIEPAMEVDVWPAGRMPGTAATEPEKIVPPKDGEHVLLLTNVSHPTLKIFPAPNAPRPAPAIIVCPGGGYGVLAMDLEGTEIASWLNSVGITALLLKYRVPNNRDGALQDVQRALSLARSHADAWGIDAGRLGVLGFSAGGHLSVRASNDFEHRTWAPIDDVDRVSCRPDFAVLVYPAYLEKAGKLAPDLKIDPKGPPALLIHNEDDASWIASSRVYDAALTEAGVPHDFIVYRRGGHGYGLRSTEEVRAWPEATVAWLRRHSVASSQAALRAP
jgi:lysophospholipase L1-like esterase/acetyl esterase/lipase